jgi:hypothetical protein
LFWYGFSIVLVLLIGAVGAGSSSVSFNLHKVICVRVFGVSLISDVPLLTPCGLFDVDRVRRGHMFTCVIILIEFSRMLVNLQRWIVTV